MMANGRVAERGTYVDLIAKAGGSFKALMESYHGEEESDGEEGTIVNGEAGGGGEDGDIGGDDDGDDGAEGGGGDGSVIFEGRIGEVTESAVAEAEGAPGTAAAAAAAPGSPTGSNKRRSVDTRSFSDKAAPLAAAAAGISVGGRAASAAKKKHASTDTGNTITKEARSEGAISSKTYWTYIKNMGSATTLAGLFCMAVFERSLNVSTSVWLALWSENHFKNLNQGDYLGVYAGIGLSQAAVSWVRTFAWALASLAAANTLHLGLFKATLTTRLSFFDTTPLGRVIQRFTKAGPIERAGVSDIEFGIYGLRFGVTHYPTPVC
jgi:hypothetical protein